MKRKLEFKDIVGYLPHGLKGFYKGDYLLEDQIYDIVGGYKDTLLTTRSDYKNMIHQYIVNIKPILEPISNLTEERAEEIGLDSLSSKAILYVYKSSKLPQNNSETWLEFLHYRDVQILYKHHFDVHGLIEKGLAVDGGSLGKDQ